MTGDAGHPEPRTLPAWAAAALYNIEHTRVFLRVQRIPQPLRDASLLSSPEPDNVIQLETEDKIDALFAGL